MLLSFELQENSDMCHYKFIETHNHIYILVLFEKPPINWMYHPSEYVVEHFQMIE